jgi:hypothetical protein
MTNGRTSNAEQMRHFDAEHLNAEIRARAAMLLSLLSGGSGAAPTAVQPTPRAPQLLGLTMVFAWHQLAVASCVSIAAVVEFLCRQSRGLPGAIAANEVSDALEPESDETGRGEAGRISVVAHKDQPSIERRDPLVAGTGSGSARHSSTVRGMWTAPRIVPSPRRSS